MDLLGRTCNTEKMNASRIGARGFMIAGGLIWILMFFASSTAARYSDLTYSFTEVGDALFSALIPFVIAVGVFVLSLFYERLAAFVLMVAAGLTIVFGAIAGWEAGVWMSVVLFVVLPMVIAAGLYVLAANTQRACELEEAAK